MNNISLRTIVLLQEPPRENVFVFIPHILTQGSSIPPTVWLKYQIIFYQTLFRTYFLHFDIYYEKLRKYLPQNIKTHSYNLFWEWTAASSININLTMLLLYRCVLGSALLWLVCYFFRWITPLWAHENPVFRIECVVGWVSTVQCLDSSLDRPNVPTWVCAT